MELVPSPLFGSHATSNQPIKRELLWNFNPHKSGLKPSTLPFPCSHYVALKFAVAELTGKNNEIKILRHLASQPGTHPESDRVLALLDHFRVQGMNGEHDVLVFPVVGPSLGAMSCDKTAVIRRAIKSIMHQVALGTSFLHDCGVVHAGGKPVLLTTRSMTHR